jgi:hypothetical protein
MSRTVLPRSDIDDGINARTKATLPRITDARSYKSNNLVGLKLEKMLGWEEYNRR